MSYLLDTHTFLWWITEDKRLSERVCSLISLSDNDIYLSPAAGWEIAIKYSIGRLNLSDDPQTLIPSEIMKNNFMVLPITMTHTLYLTQLEQIHRDPFDRILISQSITEKMPIITKDQTIKKYEAETIW
jgi:PIN domain nuclease of toxin-antitoxin system